MALNLQASAIQRALKRCDKTGVSFDRNAGMVKKECGVKIMLAFANYCPAGI
jgi:hypothetical protein